MSPLLLFIFINDLPAIFLDSIPWLFADDLKLLFCSLNFENNIARLALWNLSNGMIANVEKTECLLLWGDVTIRLCDEIIRKVTLQICLGIIVTSNLKWTIHFNYGINRARRAFFLLKSTTPLVFKYNLNMSTVVSIILYGSRVWQADTQMLGKLQNFQNFCFHWIFGCRLSHSEILNK